MASVRVSRRVAAFARELRSSHSYAFVLLLILVAFAFGATAPDAPWSRGALVLIEAGTLLVALWTSRSGPLMRPSLAALVLLTLTIGIAVAQILTDSEALTTIAGACGGLLVIAIIAVIVRGVAPSSSRGPTARQPSASTSAT
jgi:peptidoglycan/LPS O-acetylase OafA/YrhL